MDNKIVLTEIHFISLCTVVADFLLNTKRFLKAIELCKECLIHLNNKALGTEFEKRFDRAFLYVKIYHQLFNGYGVIHDNTSAIGYGKRLQILYRKGGSKRKEELITFKLAELYQRQSRYKEAKLVYMEALNMAIELKDREEEGHCYARLGVVSNCLGEYPEAEELVQKALLIGVETGHKELEAKSYGILGYTFSSRGEYTKAKQHLQKALAMEKECGNKRGEAECCGNLGIVFYDLGEYIKAAEYFQKALAISKAIGAKDGEASCYKNLAAVLDYLGEEDKAEECRKKALAIMNETGNKAGEAFYYENQGAVFCSHGDYTKAKECYEKALTVRREIGDTKRQAEEYVNLGDICLCLGKYLTAKEYHEKALTISREIGDKPTQAFGSLRLGNTFHSLGDYSRAKECHEKALEMSKEMGDIELQFKSHLELAIDAVVLGGDIHEATSNLLESIQKCEKMRGFLTDHDQINISFFDKHALSYQCLCALFCVAKKPIEALYAVELLRARALADVMSAQYSVGTRSANSFSWTDINEIMWKANNCVCLYLSYSGYILFFWILSPSKTIRLTFRLLKINACACYSGKEVERTVEDALSDETFRTVHNLPLEHCEDRSLFPASNVSHLNRESSQEDRLSPSRLVEEDEDDSHHPEPPTLSQCYEMMIAPVADLLMKPEIIIVPDRLLYKVPFAALKDENGQYLSENFRIRIIPSLTTLKLIQDSPADYHSQTGALIVGEPDVSRVYYKGSVEKLCPLPCAREEAEMIGRLLGVQPLLGEHATKQAVLQRIHSASLIHFAAHGNAERGEIALAPPRPASGIPREKDYLLTMAEISQVRLTAKLVVLSCCHSACGKIRAEGVVGIARAFLGSGARSVLVSLWALEDKATEQLMSRFYEHLARGESASESHHQAMKWMRENGYSDVGQWAPFVLIGDNVTFKGLGSKG